MHFDYIISGGLGFIGKNLISRLTGLETYQVLDRLSGDNVCDLIPIENTCKTFVHLAAFTNVRESIKRPKVAIDSNCTGVLNCLDFARSSNSHFIYTSSMGAPLTMSPYSASKYAGEAFCNAYRESYGLSTTILRLSNVYGPHSKHKSSVVAAFIKRCLEHRDIRIYGNGLQTRDFIHVDDVCSVIMSRPKTKILNVASGISTSIIDLAEIIRDISAKLTGFRPNIHWHAPVKGEIDKVGTTTDIKTTVLLEEGLKDTFEWFIKCYATPE